MRDTMVVRTLTVIKINEKELGCRNGTRASRKGKMACDCIVLLMTAPVLSESQLEHRSTS